MNFSLVAVIFLPLATAVLIALAQPVRTGWLSRWYALGGSVGTLAVSLIYFIGPMFGHGIDDPEPFALGFSIPWVEEWGITFTLGLDGLSGLLVILTNVLMVISVLASWSAIQKRRREFYLLLMVLHTGINGTFLALDLFLFYIFWELMLVPLYFLIGIFGSSRRIYATMKFFLYTMAGSVLMLLGIIALYFQAEAIRGEPSFLLKDLLSVTGQFSVEVGS